MPAIKSDTAGEESDDGEKEGEEGRRETGIETRVEGDREREREREPPTALDAYLRTRPVRTRVRARSLDSPRRGFFRVRKGIGVW